MLNVYLRVKRVKEALSEYEKAAALSPYNSDYQRDLAWAYYLNSKPEEALERAKKATELDPGIPSNFFVLAFIYHSEGKVDKGL